MPMMMHLKILFKMKFETLLTRLKRIGYKNRNLNSEEELLYIQKYIYDKYNILAYPLLISPVINEDPYFLINYNKFTKLETGKFISQNFNGENYNKYYNYYEALFHTIKVLLPGLKFQLNK